MSLDSLMKVFMPKDRVFFHLFEDVSKTLLRMADVLIETASTTSPEKRLELIKEIERLEHVNDEYTHKIFIELGQNFITPFDREDIHSLASALDDIADFIHGSSKRIKNYKINSVNETIVKLAHIISDAIVELEKAILALRTMKQLKSITDACVKINSYENAADEVYDAAISYLFENEKDPIVLIKMREIYQSLEMATDKCEDAANVLESIIVKYA